MVPSLKILTGAVVATVVAALAVATGGSASAAVPATVSPVVAAGPGVARATAMPTAQINGVVWAQAIAGNTVYAGGQFTSARPPGAAAGTGESPRTNLMSYNLSTGALNRFAPVLNGQVRAITTSPDGSIVYVGGEFTKVGSVNRYRIAAFNAATGALLPFAVSLDYTVYSIVTRGNTVYFGGGFVSVNGQTRNQVAAVRADTAALLPFDPSVADGRVFAIALSKNGTRLIIGGSFSAINGVQALGLGAVDTSTSATTPFAANRSFYAYGSGAAVLSLASNGTTVYGTAYNFFGTGNLEGSFAADDTTGTLTWLEDCHGDTYSVFPDNSAVYVVGHPHNCENIGGFPQVASDGVARRALAFTPAATGTVQHDKQSGYADFYGNPSPSLIDWMPDLTAGTFTGQNQAAWSVTGNSTYVLLGGEFATVNGQNQQGLTRMAVAGVSPDTSGPLVSYTSFEPTTTSLGTGALRVAFTSNYDRDDLTLNYTVYRDSGVGTARTAVWTGTGNSTFWNRPQLAFADKGLTPGGTYRYRLYATDAAGNQAVGEFLTVTAPTSGNPPADAAPRAAFTRTVSGAVVAVDGTTSTDSDGQVSRWAWNFGDGATAATKTASHRYAAAGTYTVTLTVTDDRGATNTTTQQVAVTVPNQAPTATFTVSGTGLAATFNASASRDPDGSIAGYAWTFGDGSTGTGVTTSHTYRAGGTYAVTLTTTDNRGAKGTLTKNVAVSTTPVLLAQDTFARTVTAGWGTANQGGAWTSGVASQASQLSVTPGAGALTMPAGGAAPTAYLGTAALTDTDSTLDLSVSKLPAPGAFVYLVARHTAAGDYRLRLKVFPTGAVQVALVSSSGPDDVVLGSTVDGPTLAAGRTVHLELKVTGSAQVSLAGRVWTGSSRPAAWTVTATDTSTTFASGTPGVATYLSSAATNAPVVLKATAFSVSTVPA